MLETAFYSWVRDVEHKIADGSDYPLIDYSEIDMGAELVDCWPSAAGAGIEPVIEFLKIDWSVPMILSRYDSLF